MTLRDRSQNVEYRSHPLTEWQTLHGAPRAVDIATTAVTVLCLVAMLVVGAWSLRVKGKGRMAFKLGLLVVVWSAIIFFALATINQVLFETDASTRLSHITIPHLKRWISFFAALVALMVLHAIIHNRFTRIWCCGASRFRAYMLLHYSTPTALSFLWMVESMLLMKFKSKYPDYDASDIYHVMVPLANGYLRVDAALHILYFVATLDVLICAILIFGGASARNDSGRTSTYLAYILAPSFLISSCVLAVYSVYFLLLHNFNPYVNLLLSIFVGFPSVAASAGLVLVGLQDDWFDEERHIQPAEKM